MQKAPLNGGAFCVEKRLVCPAGTEAFFICCLGRLRRGLGRRGHARRALQKKLSKACTLRVVFCALRARRPFLFVVWAACAACGKAGPVMGLRPLLGPPCIPPEAPPWGFPASDISRGLRGCRCGSFLAALGDLPPRRAMPSVSLTLTRCIRVLWIRCV